MAWPSAERIVEPERTDVALSPNTRLARVRTTTAYGRSACQLTRSVRPRTAAALACPGRDYRPDQAQKTTPTGKVLVLVKGGGYNLVYEDEVAVYVKAPRNQRVLPKRPS